MKIEEAFELCWQEYWDEVKRQAGRDDFDILEAAYKNALKAAYKSGFYKSRQLSVLNSKPKKCTVCENSIYPEK